MPESGESPFQAEDGSSMCKGPEARKLSEKQTVKQPVSLK